MRKMLYAFEIAAACLVLCGCDDRDDEVRVVQVSRTHVCDVDCHEHYVRDGRVVVIEKHRHGPGCGHEWDGGHWVVYTSTRRPIRATHVCTLTCRHYYDGGRVVQLGTTHRHTAGCGHVYDGQRWVIRRQPTRTRR